MIDYSTKNKALSFMEAYHQETLGKAMAHTFPYYRYMVFSVLHNRMFIDRKVIQKFLHSKKLIVNERFDLCFLEYEKGNVIASIKKLQSQDHMAIEISTVKRNTTFTWADEEASHYYNVYIFEDVYQIMSYFTLINYGLVPELEPNSIMLSLI